MALDGAGGLRMRPQALAKCQLVYWQRVCRLSCGLCALPPAPPTPPPGPPPPLSVGEAINARYVAGRPSDELQAAGVPEAGVHIGCTRLQAKSSWPQGGSVGSLSCDL